MRILVTGGLGFIGSNFVNYWRRTNPGDDIYILDAATYAARPVSFLKKDEFVWRVDLRNFRATHGAFIASDPEVVVHFAAETHVCRSIKGPEDFVTTNVNGTFNLLEAARRAKFKGRFLHVSTDEVFGEISTGKFHEEMPARPRSPYAASKAASDHLVQCYHHTYGMDTVITNCSNNFGPNQHPEKLVPRTIQRILGGQPVIVHGTGDHVRDWLFVDDHCSALKTVLTWAPAGERYCIGGELELRNLDMIDAVYRKLREFKPNAELKLEHNDDRPTDDVRYAIDNRKIRALGWAPNRAKFMDNIGETIGWYLEARGGEPHGRVAL